MLLWGCLGRLARAVRTCFQSLGSEHREKIERDDKLAGPDSSCVASLAGTGRQTSDRHVEQVWVRAAVLSRLCSALQKHLSPCTWPLSYLPWQHVRPRARLPTCCKPALAADVQHL